MPRMYQKPWTGVLLTVLTAAPAATQPPTLGSVILRAGEYVVGYTQEFASVVAEETYVQDARGTVRLTGRARIALPEQRHRELKSDVLLVRLPGADAWLQFRDVFEVDGKAVRDRADRLAKLFLQSSSSAVKQAEQIVTES